jgi:hypothetical protein
MSIPPPSELNDETLVLQLRAQWALSPFGGGESSWSFVMVRTGFVDQAAELRDRWFDQIKPLFMARRPSDFELVQVVIEDRWPQIDPPIFIDVNEWGDPANPQSAPPQITPVVSWYSNYPGRSYRGRTYWGAVRFDDIQGGGVNSDLLVALGAFVSGMDAQFIGPTGITQHPKLATVSRRHNGVPEPKGRYALTRLGIARFYLGIQRRRLTNLS